MAYIQLLNEELPGIVGLLHFRPETARPLLELAEILLRGENSLSSGEREIIASYVSYLNDCHFCHSSHGAAAAHHLGTGLELVNDIKKGLESTPLSPKMRALLLIAGRVQEGGKSVRPEDIAFAREQGASDREIHDTVLIAAAFCMYNRYVDGLGTWSPDEIGEYDAMGKRMAQVGYQSPAAHPELH